MLKLRLQRVMVFVCIFTILFVIYQLSNSEPIRNSNEQLMFKNIEKSSLQDYYEVNTFIGNEVHSVLTKSANSHSPTLSPDTIVGTLKNGQSSELTRNAPALFKGEKIVHIDLKGAPLKVSYFKEFFPLIKSLGATGLLVEYEDMFPYSNFDIPAGNAYSRNDIKELLQLASKNNLEVIPLVQTFGHLEFVLKLKEFENLRETPRNPQVICPSRNGTSQLLRGMIDDLVALHPAIKFLHIGCDEVYSLGECSQCMDVMLNNNWTKKQLFLNHVVSLAKYVKEKYPHVKPLTWDDEFRQMSVEELTTSEVGSLIEPVVWKYTPSVETYLLQELWEKYAAVFGSVWIASAFKGATGPDKFITDINYHLENHRSWMRLVASYSDRLTFKGLMVTGWSRYDHFAVLCELLPVGLPSLAVNLAFVSQGDIDMQRVPQAAVDRLGCGPGLLYTKIVARCHFPGSVIYEKAGYLSQLVEQIAQMEDTSEFKGWVSEYNVRMGFSSPAHVEGATAEVDRFKMELTYLEQDLTKAMSEVYDEHTVLEWVKTYISPVHKRLLATWDAREQLLAKSHWQRRPLRDDL